MSIYHEIEQASENQVFQAQGWHPLYAAPKTAKILIIGQAPGLRTQLKNEMWRDASGDRLRDWMGIDEDIFYQSGLIGVLPMDFYFPGKGKSGDLPPRPLVAEKWHARLIGEMPQVTLTILIGAYAQHYYLQQPKRVKITDNIRDFTQFLPAYFPLVHPSPRNNIWLAQNPWFESTVLPALKQAVQQALK
ncbi:uracil-DNA glycosylase family protein [Weissella kandleri]|uniref:uracil-DNA glycosylase family protein n=1 Tax=Weissella kandleri TaxID=1616 RepID=UPI00387EABBF